MIHRRAFFFYCFLFFSQNLIAQNSIEVQPISCFGINEDAFSQVKSEISNAKLRETKSNIEVTYIDFPESAKAAFEAATTIWESYLVSNQTIRIKASWQSLPALTLAQSGATRIYNNFINAPIKQVWYPAALAKAISGKDLNNGDYDINVNINKEINWSYDLSGKPVGGRFDMITVVLHEIAHGLGFNSSFGLTDDLSQGKWGQSSLPFIYDNYVYNGSNVQLIDNSKIGNPSQNLKTELESNFLFFNLSSSIYSGRLPQLSAPNVFKSGGSISHLEETTYPFGNSNSLMTPSIRSSEVNHNPGGLTLLILNQMGWGVRNLPSYSSIITANEVENAGFKVYPNPVSEILTIKLNSLQNESAFASIFDLYGRELKRLEFKSQSSEIDVSNIPNGIYFLCVNTGSEINGFFAKIVIHH